MDDKLKKRIELRKDEGSFRELTLKKGSIDFFSNDYLGLAREKPSPSQYLRVRQVQGSYQETRFKPWIVKRLSSFYDSEDAIVYNSGYDANVGFISLLLKGVTIYYTMNIYMQV